jgi:hypothetical protein
MSTVVSLKALIKIQLYHQVYRKGDALADPCGGSLRFPKEEVSRKKQSICYS